MKRWLLVALVLVLALMGVMGACAPPTEGPPAEGPPEEVAPPSEEEASPPSKPDIEILIYMNSEYGFSAEYPNDWEFEEGLMETIVLFAGPLVAEEFMININILSEELHEFPKTTLEDYARLSEMGIKRSVDYYEKVDEHSSIIDGQPAIVRSYIAEMDGFRHMQTQAYFFKENVAYVITYAAPTEFHDEYYDCFELIIATLKFE